MKTLKNTVAKFETMLNNALNTTGLKMSKNDGSFGVSYYLYLNVNDKFVNPLKIRLSDHSVTSTNRVLNEVHVPHNNNSMQDRVNYIERTFYPERFKEVKTIKGTRKIEWSKKNIADFTGAYKKIGERVTKKGSVQVILEIPVFKTTFERI